MPCKGHVSRCGGSARSGQKLQRTHCNEEGGTNREVKAKTRNENFSSDVKINHAIRHEREWENLHDDDMTADDLFDSISQHYGLSEFVSD